MEIEELFVQASESFEERDYHQGLEFISKCILQDETNSLLFSNRGLFYAQLGENELAAGDLNKAIELSHLNYVAYFNLFSLLFRSGCEEEAFDNLCCSLSSLYLLRAKKSQRELDVQRSIGYADNNFEAYVLKSMMYLQDGRLSQALNCMDWACDLNGKSILAKKLRNIIARRVDPYAPAEFVEEGEDESKGTRLKSSYKAQYDFMEEVVEKVKEFIEVYNDILGEDGAVTQKVPRILTENDKTFEKSGFSELSGIYEFKLRASKVGEVAHSRGKVSQAPTKQNNRGSDSKESVLLEQGETSVQKILPVDKAGIPSKQQLEVSEENLLDGSTEYQVVVRERVEENLLIQENQQNLLEEEQEPESQKVFQKKEQQKQELVKPRASTGQSSKASSEAEIVESIALYPIGDRKKIQFTVVGAEIKNGDKSDKSKDCYLTGNYNSRKGQRLRTQIKKTEENRVKWNSGSPPTIISETKKTLEVKLYSKQYFSVNDELIGQGEIEILRSGMMKFPIYYRTKMTGFVSIRIDLI